MIQSFFLRTCLKNMQFFRISVKEAENSVIAEDVLKGGDAAMSLKAKTLDNPTSSWGLC